MISDDKLESCFEKLGRTAAEPPPRDALEREVGEIEPVRPRAPLRELGILALASFLYAGGLLLVFELRRDLEALPRLWMVLYVLAWLASFVAITYLAVVPPRGQVMSRWRWAGVAAAIACVVFTIGGLLFARGAPGVSMTYHPTVRNVLRYGAGCLEIGLATALVPVALATLFLRRVMAVRARWVAAAIGAAGGSLGGLFLHIHCPITERFHVGLIHGGVVVIGALLSALLLPRLLRP